MLTSMKLSIALCIVLGFMTGIEAFSQPSTPQTSKIVLQAEKNAMTSRRGALFGIVAATVGAATVPEEASARYSSYVAREQDWAERQANGQVNYKNAKDLRQELREIAPMNNASSKIFCPNGPSAAVSPLMENKCGDKMALPSVYGRTQDTVGNSIPGFATSYRGSDLSNSGGFPSYR